MNHGSKHKVPKMRNHTDGNGEFTEYVGASVAKAKCWFWYQIMICTLQTTMSCEAVFAEEAVSVITSNLGSI